jgi:hypothetical protein
MGQCDSYTDVLKRTTPAEWNSAIVLPMYKKGYRKDRNKYREINLLNPSYKKGFRRNPIRL